MPPCDCYLPEGQGVDGSDRGQLSKLRYSRIVHNAYQVNA